LVRRHEVVLGLIFVLSLPALTPYLRGDGVGYYAWLRSPVIDRDLQFRNEFRRADPVVVKYYFNARGRVRPDKITDTGHVRNQFSVGTAVAWAPFFVAAHAGVNTMRAAGFDRWPADGYALPYLWLVAFATALFGFLALVISYRIARRIVSPGAALLGTIAVWGASSLIVYQYFLPFRPSTAGALVGAALILVWWHPGWGTRRWLLMGVLCGFQVILHPTGVAWLALPALALLGFEPGRFAQRARGAAIFVAGAVVGALPQMIGKAIVMGSPFNSGYQDYSWDFLTPNIWRVLFGSQHGIVTWTPITGLALIGLATVVWQRNRRLVIGLGAVFALLVYIVAAHSSGEAASYGNRFLVAFTPGFVIGAAGLAEAARRHWRRVAIAVAGLAVVWNLMFAFQWAWGLVPKAGGVEWPQMIRNQFTTAPRELMTAVRLFATDRGALIKHVQDVDLERREFGDE
jgi:hypothetical protein